MPDIASRGRELSTTSGVEYDRMQGYRLFSRGAAMLLILLALTTVIAIAALRSRVAGSQHMTQATASSYSGVRPLPVAKEDEAMIIEPTEASGQNANQAVTADIQVNGKSIPIPENGETAHHETTENNGSKTTVDVMFDSSTTGSSSAQSSSTLNLNVQSDQVSGSEEE